MSRPRLDILSGDLTGRSYTVDEDEFLIGRGRNCDLVIPKRYISREHARIVRSRNAFVIGGLSEKNPVVVGDRPIREHPLQDGDVFEMCGIQFRFSIPKKGRKQPHNNASTVESQSGIGWRDEDTEGGFGERARERQRRQTKSREDSWAEAPSKKSPKKSRKDSGWEDDGDWQKDDGWASESAPRVPDSEPADDGWRSESAPAADDGWRSESAPAEDDWEDEPRGKLADSWSDDEESAPPPPRKKKTAARKVEKEDSWDDDDDDWDKGVPDAAGGRKSGVVFEVDDDDDDDDPNDATGAMSAKKLSNLSSRGSGVRESDAERTAELNKQLDPDDPDYDPFAQIDSEGPKSREVDPNREKLLRVLALIGLVGLFAAYMVYAKITEQKPPTESVHTPTTQTYVGGSTLVEVTWQAADRPIKPGNIDWENISGEPEDERLLSFDGVAKVEWVLPRLERSLFLIQGVGEGTTSFKIYYPTSNRLVTYNIEVTGEDPHANARDRRQADFRNNKSPRELALKMKESFNAGQVFTKGRTLPQKEGYYRKAYLAYGEALDAAEALAAAEQRRGGKTQATLDWVTKCKEAELRAQDEWEERLTRELARYRNLVADGSTATSDRREQLRSVLRLIGHTCDVRFRRLETFLREAYGSALVERESCPHDEN
jgi:pSer/pThr/pTyr-binding forkhead associated (FHA) protein